MPKLLTTDEIIQRARVVHGDFYNYSLVKETYSTKERKLHIICPIHGKFIQQIDDHISAKAGCRPCSSIDRKETNLKKYGVENVSSNLQVKEKKVRTCTNNHGYSNPSFVPKILAQISAANKTVGLEKSRKTCMEKYGTNSCQQATSVRDKYKETSIRNWGTEYPMQSAKCIDSLHHIKCKLFTFPSGNSYYVQGYEPRAILQLLSEGYNESDLVLRNRQSFKYEWDSKLKVYHPDIIIPKDKLVVEVKSTFIYSCALEQNLAKKEAVEKAGWNFRFIIYD